MGDDERDKSAILARRANLIASMLASLGAGCSGPEQPPPATDSLEAQASARWPGYPWNCDYRTQPCPCLQPPPPPPGSEPPQLACDPNLAATKQGLASVCQLLHADDPEGCKREQAKIYRAGWMPLPCDEAARESLRATVCAESEVEPAKKILEFCSSAPADR